MILSFSYAVLLVLTNSDLLDSLCCGDLNLAHENINKQEEEGLSVNVLKFRSTSLGWALRLYAELESIEVMWWYVILVAVINFSVE